MNKVANWWGKLYDDLLAELLLENRTEDDVKRSLNFLRDNLQLKGGETIMDQCCGTGSLSIPLAQEGFDVIGVDQAEKYILEAQEKTEESSLAVSFYAADAFEFVSPKLCDAVFNWWTSFGYTLDDEANAQMLQRAADSLKVGGLFLLDTLNLPGVMRHFNRDVITRKESQDGEIVLMRETSFDWQAGAMLKKWTYLLPSGETVSHDSVTRLYLPHTICELLERSGFEVLELFGNEDGDPLSLDSMRCIILARKKA